MKTLGERLKKAREEMRLSQLDAAKKIGISNGTLSGYERNYRDPDTNTLKLISELYEVSLDWLLTGVISTGSRGENIFFKEYEKLSEDDKQKALEHIKFLRHLAEQENKHR
jgi:transcriptional regulator with XRE-family HTH domain